VRIGRAAHGGLAALLLLLSCLAVSAQAPTFPPLSGRVVDDAGILDVQTEALLQAKLADLETKTTNQLVVVTLKSLQGYDIADYGYRLGRHWGIGLKEKNNGALLIVAPNERRVRIEVGYGLEGSLTDAVTRLIIENAILPRFRANDFAGGVTRGVDDIVAVLSGQAAEYKQRAAKRPDSSTPALNLVTVILFLIIAFIVIRSLTNSKFRPSRRRGLWGAAPILVPTSGGSWESGSGGGFSGGGGFSDSGGFSGGGGSFGGGGSSGEW
jgi:uncharacterized protein